MDDGLALLAGLAEALDAGFPLEAGALAAFAVVALGFGFVAAVFAFDSPVTAYQYHLNTRRKLSRHTKCTFLAGGFFALLAFLAAGFFATLVLALPVVFDFFAVDVYFLVVAVVAAGFGAAAFGLAGVVEALVFNGFLAVVDFFAVFLAVVDLALVATGFLAAGLAFYSSTNGTSCNARVDQQILEHKVITWAQTSFAASLFPFPASLTLPEGPRTWQN